jgi:hypothetical protein
MSNEKELVEEAMNIVDNMDMNEVYAVSGSMATFIVGLGVSLDLPPGLDPVVFGDALAQVAILSLDRYRGKYADLDKKAKEYIAENGRPASPFKFN